MRAGQLRSSLQLLYPEAITAAARNCRPDGASWELRCPKLKRPRAEQAMRLCAINGAAVHELRAWSLWGRCAGLKGRRQGARK